LFDLEDKDAEADDAYLNNLLREGELE